MKPLNDTDRSKSFWRFIFFYFLSLLVIVGAVYAGLRIPFKENKYLLAHKTIEERKRNFDEVFFKLMDETVRQLDTVNLAGTKIPIVDANIEQNIKNMSALVNESDVEGKGTYNQIIDFLAKAKADKITIRSSNKDQMSTQIQQLNNVISAYKQQNDDLRRMLGR